MSYIKWCLSIAFDSERRAFVTSLITWHCIQMLGPNGNSSLSGTKRKMQDEGEYMAAFKIVPASLAART